MGEEHHRKENTKMFLIIIYELGKNYKANSEYENTDLTERQLTILFIFTKTRIFNNIKNKTKTS